MKSKKHAILVCFVAVSILACNSNQKTIELRDSSSVASADTTANAGLAFKSDQLKSIYNSYTKLKDALVSSNAADAKPAATELATSLKGLEGCESATHIAEKIGASSDLKAQRAAFTDLNVELIPVFKHATVTSGTIYVQYCPMANNGDGANWLSSHKKIQNPYYGDEMMECGRVTEEIKGK